METGQDELAPFIWIGGSIFLLLLLLTFMIILFKVYIKRIKLETEEKAALERSYQQNLLSNSVKIQENERERIAADLHDNLIAQLHRIKLMNQDNELNTLLGDSISTARNISHDLTPPLLDTLSISDLIHDFIHPIRHNYQLTFNKSIQHQLKQHKEKKLHLFRIFQELISNIIKHAQASKIDISLRITANYTCLSIQDNGIGFDLNRSSGLGLKNIELRTQVLQGNYRIKKNQPQGTISILLLKNQPQHL